MRGKRVRCGRVSGKRKGKRVKWKRKAERVREKCVGARVIVSWEGERRKERLVFIFDAILELFLIYSCCCIIPSSGLEFN